MAFDCSSSIVEKLLPNGDFYVGGFSGNIPHGLGKYLWMDGSMYEGEWKRGKATGKGKYSWPSGATYEGDFEAGRMNGFGTFTESDGGSYCGSWIADRKHGFGQKRYANDDFYEGSWKQNLQDGQGRYVWMSGNEYVGEWKNGLISGRGVLIWRNGNRYEGQWDNGGPKGQGIFTWPDGSCYAGYWNNEMELKKRRFCASCEKNDLMSNGTTTMDGARRSMTEKNFPRICICELDGEASDAPQLNGPFHPNYGKENYLMNNGPFKGNILTTAMDSAGRSMADKIFSRVCAWESDGEATDAQHSGPFHPGYGKENYLMNNGPFRDDNLTTTMDCDRRSMTEMNFPRVCIWESDGGASDISDIIDNLEASKFFRDGKGLEQDDIKQLKQFRRNTWCFSSEVKRPGQTISKGHKNYYLMLNLQLGIRYSVGKEASILRELEPGDFDPKEKFWTRFPPNGSKVTPPHRSVEFQWKDYCPMVLRHLRKLFLVDPVDYMLAICGDDALWELSSPGNSGSVFLTQDDRFMIKTIRKSEVKVLLGTLRSYYQHVSKYKYSLVIKFYGLHCVKPIGGKKTRFVVMGNLFCSEYGRMTDESEEEIDETKTLKDLDLSLLSRLQQNWYQDLIRISSGS